MSERHVTLRTRQIQRPYGDAILRAEVDFHLHESDFGGAPVGQVAIDTVKLLWPAARNVELKAERAPHAQHHGATGDGQFQADRWIVRGTVSYRG